MNIGPLEIAIVVLVIVLLFGARRLPELGSGLGRGLREFKDGVTGNRAEDDEETLSAKSATPRESSRTPES